jgi:hypothetical protein
MDAKERELLEAIRDSVRYLLNHLCNGSFWYRDDKCTGCHMLGSHTSDCPVKELLDKLDS